MIKIKIGRKEFSIEEAQEIYGDLKKLFNKEDVMYEYVPYDAHFLAGGGRTHDTTPYTLPELWL